MHSSLRSVWIFSSFLPSVLTVVTLLHLTLLILSGLLLSHKIEIVPSLVECFFSVSHPVLGFRPLLLRIGPSLRTWVDSMGMVSLAFCWVFCAWTVTMLLTRSLSLIDVLLLSHNPNLL